MTSVSESRKSRSLLAISTLPRDVFEASVLIVPNVVDQAGELGRCRFVKSFTADIRSADTHKAYVLAIGEFLAGTKLQDRTGDAIMLKEMERIRI